MTEVGFFLFLFTMGGALIGVVVGIVAMARWRGPFAAKLAAGFLFGLGAFVGASTLFIFAGAMFLFFH